MPRVLLFDFLGLYTSLHPFFNAKTPRESHPLSLWQYNVVELVPWGLRKRELMLKKGVDTVGIAH